MPEAADPHDLREVRGRVRAAVLAPAAQPGQVGDQVLGALAREGAGVGGGHH